MQRLWALCQLIVQKYCHCCKNTRHVAGDCIWRRWNSTNRAYHVDMLDLFNHFFWCPQVLSLLLLLWSNKWFNLYLLHWISQVIKKKKKKPCLCIYTSLLQIIWLGPRRILPKLFPTMFLIKFIMQEDNLFLFLEFELFILTPFKSENVSFIPQLTNNLFYVGQFVEYNCLDVSSLFGWVVRNLDTNRVIMKGIKLEDCFIWFYMQHPQKQFI
jgi:hypothetical protein